MVRWAYVYEDIGDRTTSFVAYAIGMRCLQGFAKTRGGNQLYRAVHPSLWPLDVASIHAV